MMSMFWGTVICAVAAVVTVFLVGVPKPEVIISAQNPGGLERLPQDVKKRVLVIGGGVAGLSAALELAERGYDITIKESSDGLGGRIKAGSVSKLRNTFRVDSGHLSTFHNYHQTQDIMKRLGVQHHFQPMDANDIEFKHYSREHIYSWEPWPFNIMGIIVRSPTLSLLQSFYWIHAGYDFVNFDYNKVYKDFGHMNFDDYDKYRNLHPPFASIILRPALSMTLNDQDKFSAAEFLLYSHFFSISNPKASKRLVATCDSHTALLDAWINKLTSLGVGLQLNSPTQGLILDSKTNHVVAESNHPDVIYDHVILAADLVGVQQILKGTIDTTASGTKAHDIIKNISDSSVSKLTLAPPYKLLWVWFDKQLQDPDAPVMLQTPEFSPITCVTQLHLLHKQYMEWANQTRGSVFLFDMYAWNSGNVEDDQLWQFISPTVKKIYPEIFDSHFKVLDFHVFTGATHPAYLKDMEQYRPHVTLPNELGIPNLSFAGDWLHASYPSVFMERAISTGREAANHVLLSDGVKQVPLKTTNSRGPGFL